MKETRCLERTMEGDLGTGGYVKEVYLSPTESPVFLKTSKSDHHSLDEDILANFVKIFCGNKNEESSVKMR